MNERLNSQNETSIIGQIKVPYPQILLESAMSTKVELNANKDDVEHYDIIIVGAGLAGLSAGYHLKKADKNLRILIVEAKDRVGGRTQTVKLKCSKEGKTKEWDVGGQWVADTQKNVTGLMKEFSIQTYKQFDSGISILEANKKMSKYKTKIPRISLSSLIDLQLIIMKINRACSKTNSLDPFININHAEALNRINARQFFQKTSFTDTAKGIVNASFRAIYGLETSQLNALFATMYIKSSGGTIEANSLTEKDCAQEKRVKGGTQQISQRLLDVILSDPNTARIIFEAPLVEVNQEQNDRVFIKVANLKENREEIYSCKKLISAIPLNQYCTIKFFPDLPFYKKNFFTFCKIGNYVKTIVTYKKAFWIEKGYSGMVVSDGTVFNNKGHQKTYPNYGPVTTVFDGTTEDGEPALITFRGGQVALEWADQDYEFRKGEVIDSLVRYFGPEAADFLDYCEKNWNAEPYNGGCPNINVVASDVLQDYARATREPFLNLHLCGTESAVEWQGYMDGAIESGIRVANEVAYCFSKDNPSLKYDYSKTYYHQKEEIDRLKKLDRKKSKKNYYQYFLLFGLSLAAFYYFSKNKIYF